MVKIPILLPVVMGRAELIPYIDKIPLIFGANILGYWPMNEASGTTADNAEGTAARDGTYIGVTLGQTGIGDGNTCPLFDGATTAVNLFSASLQSAFDGTLGSFGIWAKVSAAGDWTDGTQRFAAFFNTWSGQSGLTLTKETTNNKLRLLYRAGNTNNYNDKADATATGWFHIAITWNKAADEVKTYYNGSQLGLTLTGLGVFDNVLAPTTAVLGSSTSTPGGCWKGYLAHAWVLNRVATAAEIAQAATV